VEYLNFARDTKQWNRRIINIFWVVVVLSFVIEFVNLFLSERSFSNFFIHYLLIPTLLLTLITSITEIIYYRNSKYIDFIIIINATLLAGILVYVHSTIIVIWATFFLPSLVSIFYFRKNKIIFAFITSFVVYSLLVVLHSEINEKLVLMDHFTMVALLGACSFICIGIMKRGAEIFDNLKETLEIKQELIIRNTIMEKLSKTDALTGLYNHISFHEYLESILEQSNKYHIPIQLAIIDIDDFKKVNDIHGHRIGDIILERISSIIKENVNADDFVARYGGEEFVVLFVGKPFADTFNVVERIRVEVSRLTHEELGDQSVTISIGLNEYEIDTDNETLFKGADTLLYLSKKNGKNMTTTKESALIFN
jgi:diguanylate cyclase (GGDEF)-like protein